MKANKISIFLIVSLYLFNIIFTNLVYAAQSMSLQEFTVKVNSGSTYASNVNANPGDTIRMLFGGSNDGDSLTNVKLRLNFSSTDISYLYPGTIDSYKNFVADKSNISTSDFNPPSLNDAPVSDSSVNGDYHNLYYLYFQVNTGFTNTSLDVGARYIADGYAGSNQITRTIFVNVRPHITDYYFEKSGSPVTSIQNDGSDTIDLVLKVKDFNGCSNIDAANVTANLASLGYSTSEILSYISCDTSTKTATYKKTGITTLVATGSYNFEYTKFLVTDENSNQNDPSDTKFNSIDKTATLALTVQTAGTPTVTINSLGDNYIGSATEASTVLNFTADQNGNYKVSAGSDGQCNGGTTLTDWTAYTSGTPTNVTINAANINVGANTIYVCVRNGSNQIGSSNTSITKDITAPSLSIVTVSPANVTTQNSVVTLKCGEDGLYKVCKGSGCDSVVQNWTAATANTNVTATVNNAILSVGSNSIYMWCRDNASNETSDSTTITKVDNPPSMVGGITLFEDNDVDYDGLDGRDFHLTWDNTSGVNYSSFESWRVYILPSGTALNTSTHNYKAILGDKNLSSWQGASNITTDSVGNAFVNGASYVAHIAIMSSAGILGTAGSSSPVVFTADSVSHPTILTAKFTSSTLLELNTNATLDTVLGNHDGTKVSYKIGSTTYTGSGISSVNGTKLYVTIPNNGSASATGNTLVILTGAIHSAGGGYNNYFSSGSLVISDAQVPVISSFTKVTSAGYGTFYKGNINFTYTFSENMLGGGNTYYEFTRTAGQTDGSTRYYYISSAGDLTAGAKSNTFSLDTLGLVCGTTYQVRVVGKDGASNQGITSYIPSISFDNCGPSAPTLSDATTFGTGNFTLSWAAPSDQSGYGAGVKDYRLRLYNGNGCSSLANTYNAVTGTSKEITGLANGDYSWDLTAFDQLNNTGTVATCDDFTVDTSVPVISSQIIKDTTLNNFSYTKDGDNIQITANISNTDSSHIWLNASALVGGGSTYNNVQCSSTGTPSITCSYNAGVVTYNMPTGFAGAIADGSKSVVLTSQNIGGLNTQTKNLSITVDNTVPNVAASTLITPNGLETWGGNQTITWNTADISDAIGLSYIKLEYSTGTHTTWTTIATGSNTGSYSWNLNGLSSSTDYRVRITAYDYVGNNSSDTSAADFTIDLNGPTVPSNTITAPNGNQLIKGGAAYNITWNNAGITDLGGLAANPIDLYYSTDGGTNWTLIATSEANDGTYSWAVPAINNSTVKVRLIAYDNSGNYAYDISDNNFVIDSTSPTITMTYAGAGGATPPNSSKLSAGNLFDVSLSASDSYLNQVTYRLQNTTDSQYWDGSSWVGTSTWNTACTDSTPVGNGGNCANILTGIASTIIDGKNYSLVFRAVDEAGNITTGTNLTYVGDTTNPSITISTSNNSYYSGSALISGIGSDSGAGVSQAVLKIEKGGQYWNGSSYQGTEYWLSTSTSNNYANWNYTFSMPGADADGQVYTVTAKIIDKAYKTGNSSASSITIYKDVTGPTITGGTGLFSSPTLGQVYGGGDNINIAWNSGNFSDSGAGVRTNSITLQYWNGTTRTNISTLEANDGAYSWNSIPSIDYTAVKIRLSIKDNAGNLSTQDSDAFIIDSTPPSIQSVETMENGISNGKINALKVVMSEPISDASVVLADFSISGVGTPTSKETGATPNDDTFILNFADYGTTASTPTLTYTQGSLVDLAGKNLATTSNFASVDKVGPRALNGSIYDNDSDGKIDQVVVNFSENLSNTTNTTAWTLNSPVGGSSLNTVSVSTSQATLNLNEGTIDTSTGGMNVSFVTNINWTDSSSNQAGSYPNLNLADAAKPIFTTKEFLDTNSNFKVDQIKLYLSENINSYNQGDFVISGLAAGSSVNTSSASNNLITITLNETSADNDTAITPTFDFTSGNLQDSSSNKVNSVSGISISDKVAAKLTLRETQDSDGNGKIDRIKLTFSETLNSDLSSFIASVNSYSADSYTGAGTIAYIVLNEKLSSDTSATPAVQITSNSSLQDVFGNNVLIEGSSTNSTDKVGPVIIGARYDEGGAGITDDKIYVTFSENINGASVDTTNSLNDFAINGGGSLGTDSTTTIAGANTLTINLGSTASALSAGTSQISIKTGALSDSNSNASPTEGANNRVVVTASVLINEVMWSGTGANASQYIELRNISSNPVDISSWIIQNAGGNGVDITIPGATTIAANGYYLITKSAIASSLLNISPDLIDGTLNLNPAGQNDLVLMNGVITIDSASANPWPKGTDNPPESMERKDGCGDGTSSACWYTALSSVGFDGGANAKGTPGSVNILDIIAPTIGSYTPGDSALLPISGFNIVFNYSDNGTGVGIDTATASLVFSKWNLTGTSWDDYTTTGVNMAGKTVTLSSATYPLNNIGYGKYKAHFEIEDEAGNVVSKDLIFYIDNFSVDISNNSIDFGAIQADTDYITGESTVTINTVGAGFSVDLSKGVRSGPQGIQDWDGSKGFGVDIYKNENTVITNYDNTYESLGSPIAVVNHVLSADSDGKLNQYIYKYKYKIRVDALNIAGNYTNNLAGNYTNNLANAIDINY